MKEIGSIDDPREADLFHSYLLARNIDSRIDRESETVRIWAYDDDDVDGARSELARFRAATDRKSFTQVVDEYRDRQTAERIERARKASRPRRVSTRVTPFFYQMPATLLLAATCIFVFALGVLDERPAFVDMMRISALSRGETAIDSPVPLVNYGRLVEVARGQVWRLVTPVLLHIHWPHLFVNVLMLVQFGGPIEYRRGWRQFLVVVGVLAVTSNVAQFIVTGPKFGGLSGIDAGLFGYLLVFSKHAPEDGIGIDKASTLMMFLFLGLCLTNQIRYSANAAHVVGLATGVGIAALTIGMQRAKEEFERSRDRD